MAKADYGLRYLKLAPSTEVDRSGYYQVAQGTTGAKKVVADDTASPSANEIKIGSVTPYMSTKTLAVNDYVKNLSFEIGSYIDFDTVVGLPTFDVTAIVKDSFTYTDTAPTETNIEIEDSDDFFATIKTDGGSKGFTLQTYDMSEEAYNYLLGYVKEGSIMKESVDFELPNQCVEIKTRKHGGFPSKIYRYARMSVRVNRTGTIGKSGFPNLQLEFTKLANYDASGAEIAGAEWEETTDN